MCCFKNSMACLIVNVGSRGDADTTNLCSQGITGIITIQKFTEGGFRKWGYEVAQEDYKEELLAGRLEINDIIADNFLQQILLNPEKFDVVALTNVTFFRLFLRA